MATLNRSNLIIAADVQTGRQMVGRSRREHSQRHNTHIGRKETENISIELRTTLTYEIVRRDGDLSICMVIYTIIINFTINYVKSKEEKRSGLISVRQRSNCNMQHTQLEIM
jgi:hypothetical protein